MRGIKTLIWISIVALLVTTVVSMGTSNTGTELFGGAGGAYEGETFDIYPTVSGLPTFPYPKKLFLAEFDMSFDPNLLEAVDIDIGDDPLTMEIEGLDWIWIEEIDNNAGILHVVAGRPAGTFEGLMGVIRVAKITFMVKEEGSDALSLSDSRLLELSGAELPHTTVDGLFFTPVELYIRRREAKVYPEWHSMAYTADMTNELSADIMNYDIDSFFDIMVVFIVDAGPFGMIKLESGPVTIPAATIVMDDIVPGSVTLTADFTVPEAGTFFVSAALFFEVMPDVWVNACAEGISRDIATKFKAR